MGGGAPPDWGLRDFQRRIEAIYGARDEARGVGGTFTWFVEEIGELARSLLTAEPGSDAESREFADVLAWLATLASLRGVDLAAAAREKYGEGCPRCAATPCRCSHREGGAPRAGLVS
jgi:NTP pyrophosphatase (non-canonical NTP hydrolase)